MKKANEGKIGSYLDYLCQKIGTRYSGTKAEKRAVEFIENQFREFGLDAHQEEFKFPNWDYSLCEATAFSGSKSFKLQPVPVVYSASTPAEGITSPLVYLEKAEEEDLKGIDLKGKVGIILGDLSDKGNPKKLIKMNNSGLSAIILINPEYPFSMPLSLGIPTEWEQYIKIPIVCIPYTEGYSVVKKGMKNIKMQVEARKFISSSFNVIGEIKGEGKEIITICSHHDTVILGTGADDNGSGTAFVLELARLFSKEPKPYRSLRFVPMGVEEKRSAGANYHVRQKKNIENVVLAINADTIGSVIGENLIHITGSAELRRYVKKISKRNNFSATFPLKIPWWSDHFSFNLAGIPSIWFHRRNTLCGLWHAHSECDSLENISLSMVAKTMELGYEIIKEIAYSRELPFPRGIPQEQRKQIKKMADGLEIPPIKKSSIADKCVF